MKEGFLVSEKREGRKEIFPRKKRIGDQEKKRKEDFSIFLKIFNEGII